MKIATTTPPPQPPPERVHILTLSDQELRFLERGLYYDNCTNKRGIDIGFTLWSQVDDALDDAELEPLRYTGE